MCGEIDGSQRVLIKTGILPTRAMLECYFNRQPRSSRIKAAGVPGVKCLLCCQTAGFWVNEIFWEKVSCDKNIPTFVEEPNTFQFLAITYKGFLAFQNKHMLMVFK